MSRARSASVTSEQASAAPSLAPSTNRISPFSRHTALIFSSSASEYTVPFSVGWEMYTIAGWGWCSCVASAQWASTRSRICSALIFPSGLGSVMTLCPVASMEPVSCTAMCPVSAAITA